MKLLKIYNIILLCLLTIVFGSCYKTHTSETELGNTGTAQGVSAGWYKAIIKIDVTKDNLDNFGICFSDKTQLPTIDDKTVSVDENGNAVLDNLVATTTYYWRTFIQKGDVIAYSEPKSFKTLQYPTVAMNPIDSTCNTATFNLTITGNTGYTYTETGIYSTAKNDCLDGKEFTITIRLEEFNKNYATSAYIKNSVGETAYGEMVSFTTKPRRLPVVVTQPSIVTDTIHYFVGEITDDGCPSYTEKGICFSPYEQIADASEKTLVPGEGIVTFSVCAPTWFRSGHFYRTYAIQLDTVVYGLPRCFIP